ncbi:hypothetical protein [Streptomyces glomeratus]|uniref:hypothetical protein n=1 Tax=Streptomyces glomeratus TaxID=284452 RepID=UPI001F1BC9D9|nr:hypothetical protein [Streptomyces glomeratus]MCF1507142.1 hypothetical protein [Streptomyces glomeratus]
MEQRIGPSSQPLEGAGFDPAFIPGLTSPVSRDGQDSAERKGSAEPGGSAEPEDAVPAGGKAAAGEPDDEVAAVEGDAEEAGAVEGAAEEGGAEEGGAEEGDADEAGTVEAAGEAPQGPVFEAADRRARIVADHSGVRLRLDDQECEFRWDEIGAVETETARFGKRFTVTVHTPDRRWYPIEIEATARARFKEWETRLDEVLDAYFEDGEKEPAALAKGDD